MYEKLTIFEGGRIDIPRSTEWLRVRDRLLGIMVGSKQAFCLRNGTLFATEFVGACSVGKLRLEILPKPFGIETATQARALLFDLLRWAGTDLQIRWIDGGSSARTADLLELAEQRITTELLRHLEIGPPRRYQEIEEESSVLRGRMLFSRYACRPPSQAHILPVRYSSLAADNDLARLLKALATTLRSRTSSYLVRRNLDRCLDLLAAAQDVLLTPALLTRVKLGRMEDKWRELVQFAGLLSAGQSPDPATLGESAQSTLLFPIGRLFEAAVRHVLASTMSGVLGCVRSPGEHRLLSAIGHDRTVSDALSIRPDLLFLSQETVIAPGDAKWKRLVKGPLLHSLSPSDVYQILAYMRLFEAGLGLMFFPRMSWMSADWTREFAVDTQRKEKIIVFSVDLAELMHSNKTSRQEAAVRLANRVQLALEDVPRPSAEPNAAQTRVFPQQPQVSH